MFLPWNEVGIYILKKKYSFLNTITGIDILRMPFVLIICSPNETNNSLYNFLCFSITFSFLQAKPPPLALFHSTWSQFDFSIFYTTLSFERASIRYLWNKYLSIGFTFGKLYVVSFRAFIDICLVRGVWPIDSSLFLVSWIYLWIAFFWASVRFAFWNSSKIV
jgi:hypothetical protein